MNNLFLILICCYITFNAITCILLILTWDYLKKHNQLLKKVYKLIKGEIDE